MSSRKPTPACTIDRICYRNDGHDGPHLHAGEMHSPRCGNCGEDLRFHSTGGPRHVCRVWQEISQETIVEMRPDNYLAQLRQLVDAGRARNDPTLAIAVSVEALGRLLDERDQWKGAHDAVVGVFSGRRCDFDCDACREPDEGWQQP